jgi:protein arginine kinase activator
MKCEKCNKKEAKIHFTQIKDGKVVSCNLCKDCAEKQGFKAVKFDSEQQPVFAPEAKDHVLSDLVEESTATEECPLCHSKMEDVKRSGRLGCAKCYYTFEKQIDVLLRRIQGSSFHLGKRSGKPVSEHYDDQIKIRELKKKLNESVKEEDYEAAARLRDEIRSLEKRLELKK